MSDFLRGRKEDARESRCRSDLLVREYRGELSGGDCIALRAHLADCSSCRITRRILVDLDEVSGVDSRDAARIERLSDAARRWTHRRGRSESPLGKRRLRLRTLGLAACAFLICGTASAAVWLWSHPGILPIHVAISGDPVAPTRASDQPPPGRESILPADHPMASPNHEAPTTPGGATRIVASRPGDLASGQRVNRPPRRPPVRVSTGEASASPAALLRQASDSRRSGEGERALRLYRKLQETFPGSPEAVLSSVALGGLLLAENAAGAALVQFDAYLGAARGGPLVPEALYGRGRAFAALGDRVEERKTWQRLLTHCPDSAYGPLARRRLAALK